MFCLIIWLALTGGCSSLGIRCDSHLRPINPRQPPLSRQHSANRAVAGEEVKP